ncbi:MAG: hypothetical protein IT337_06790 [Thermomicrobiales bacterium]|nr:hypothetical protein [Thermomicrobiales bacterium]
MNALRNLLNKVAHGGNSRFDRYYGDLVGSGSGYPTADEARRDLRGRDQMVDRYTWVR